MSSGLVDKVYIGLDNAPPSFDIKGRILGANGTNLDYIRSETGVIAILKGDKFDPLHLALHHSRSEALVGARSLALNLIETVRAELAQWSAAQGVALPQSMSVPPPILTTSGTPPASLPSASSAMSGPASLSTATNPSTVISPVVSVGSAPPLMTVRQPTVLQLLPPQQQYVLNQENGQLIPIVQPGVQVSNSNFSSLPMAQSLGTLQQQNFGTQYLDISGVQPVNVTQLRLSGVPSSMSMILPNGLAMPHSHVTGGTDTTTVSSAMSTPVVCAAQNTNSAQKLLYSLDKSDKTDLRYHVQGADTVQWAMPGSQTMLIPYQQLQELTSNQAGLANFQPQQYVSIAPAGGLQQTSLPLTAAQLQQLQATGTIMPLNQKPAVSSAPLINIISTGQASSPQTSNNTTPTKLQSNSQESRGQKRLSDGTPTQLPLRPIAPAGSVQEKTSSRESRSNLWAGAVKDSTAVSMGMKINPAHGTIIHVSSGQQTSVSTSGGITQDAHGMFIRQIDRNSIQLQTSKDVQKQDMTQSKIQSATQNVQMITVPPGMTVLQNPLSLGQMQTMLGQPNSQVYMIPANQHNLMQGGLGPGILGQQVLQPGQNVTVMQPNQLGVPNSVQYNTVPLMPMGMAPNAQYMPAGINLNTPMTAQQFNAALANQQLINNNSNLVSGTIPIVQGNPPGSPLSNIPQNMPVTQSIHQIMPHTSTYVSPTNNIQSPLGPQYIMQPNSSAIPIQPNSGLQYTMQSSQNSSLLSNLGDAANNQTTSNAETETVTESLSPITTNQSGYISSSSSQQSSYSSTGTQGVPILSQQIYTSDASASPNAVFTSTNQNSNSQSYNAPNSENGQNNTYSISHQSTAPQPASYNTNAPNTYAPSISPNGQNISLPNFSPSSSPVPQGNQAGSYPPNSIVNMPISSSSQTYSASQQANLYPNATGQNLAAYANNQYQYNNRPWFRVPRFGSPQGPSYPGPVPPSPNGQPMPVPPPSGNYNYWQDS